MTNQISRFLKARAREQDGRSRDAGDTLVELLIAITVIALTVAGLVGGLAADISTSGTHRGIASLDGIVRSFGEEARQVIELSQSPQFTPCKPGVNTTYRMVSAPYPASAPTNTAVTVFGTGFTAGGTISTVSLVPSVGAPVQVYPAAAPSPPFAAAPVPTAPSAMSTGGTNYGNTTVTFIVPSTLTAGTSYYVTVQDSSGVKAVSSTPFVRSAGGSPVDPSPLQNYTLGIDAVKYWNGTGFTSSCSPPDGLSADLQQITVKATAPGANDNYDLAVTTPVAFRAASSIPITYTGPANPPVGTTLTYTAAVNGLTNPYTGYTNPGGQLTWIVVPPSGPATTCAQSTWTLPAPPTPTCSFTSKVAGTYNVFARYAGDSNFLGIMGECPNPPSLPTCVNSPTVIKGTPSVSVTGSSNGAPFHPTLTFTATVTGGGVTPGGTVTWAVTQTGGNPNASWTCSPSPGTLNASGQATCTVSNAAPGNYTAIATYSGDANYIGATSPTSNVVNVPFLTPTISLSDSVAVNKGTTTITITATVSGPGGDPTPTGSVTWSNGLCNTSTNTLDASGQATCTIKNPASSGYFGTFTYNGDVNYSSGSKAVNIPVATGGATGQGTTNLTFTLKITGPLVGPTPTGSVTWTVNGIAAVCLNSNPIQSTTSNTTTFACKVAAVPGVNYTAQANYSGDSSYLPPFPNPTAIGPVPG